LRLFETTQCLLQLVMPAVYALQGLRAKLRACRGLLFYLGVLCGISLSGAFAGTGLQCPANSLPASFDGVDVCQRYVSGRRQLLMPGGYACPSGFQSAGDEDGSMICKQRNGVASTGTPGACSVGQLPLVDMHGELECVHDPRLGPKDSFSASTGCPVGSRLGADRVGKAACLER